jgi:hypothetical protein
MYEYFLNNVQKIFNSGKIKIYYAHKCMIKSSILERLWLYQLTQDYKLVHRKLFIGLWIGHFILQVNNTLKTKKKTEKALEKMPRPSE